MPGHTMVAYSESQDTAGVLLEHVPVPDQHITIDGDDILVPDFADKVLMAYAIGAELTQAQLSSPSLRKETLLDIVFLQKAAEPSTNLIVPDYKGRERVLEVSEGLRSLMAEGGAGAQRQSMIVVLTDELVPMPDGPVETIRLTATETLTAYAWTLATMTLSQQLRKGRYAIVGMRAKSAGLIAARLVIPGSSYRPGIIAGDDEDNVVQPIFQPGGLGNWGEFEHTFFPKIEFLSISADTSEVVYIDIVKVE